MVKTTTTIKNNYIYIYIYKVCIYLKYIMGKKKKKNVVVKKMDVNYTTYYIAKTPFIINENKNSLEEFKKQIDFDNIHSISTGKHHGIGMYLRPKKSNPNARPIMPTSTVIPTTSKTSTKSKATTTTTTTTTSTTITPTNVKIKQQFIYIPDSNSFLPIKATLNYTDSTSTFDYVPCRSKNIITSSDMKDVKQFEGVSEDYCHICADGGNLLCCDLCPMVYHKECIGLMEEPDEDIIWACPSCTKGSEYLPDTKKFAEEWKRYTDADIMKESGKKRKLSNDNYMNIVPINWHPSQKKMNQYKYNDDKGALLNVKNIDITPATIDFNDQTNDLTVEENGNTEQEKVDVIEEEEEDDGIDAFDIYE